MRELFQPMADFLASIDATISVKPSAMLVVTAHWEAPVVTVTGARAPELIFDYYGFPPDMYELTYPAPGDPELADRTASLLSCAGIECNVDANYGFDHGVFIPLKVMYPDASIPVVAMSLKVGLDPQAHVAIGRALASLRDDGVLIVGSGLSFHNMATITHGGADSVAFDDWLCGALTGDAAHRREQLVRWVAAPSARSAHPREEHLLPLMVASGAGGDDPAERLWQGPMGGSRVSAWAFN